MATQAHDYLSRHSMQLGMYLQVWSPGQEWKQHVHFRPSFSPTHVSSWLEDRHNGRAGAGATTWDHETYYTCSLGLWHFHCINIQLLGCRLFHPGGGHGNSLQYSCLENPEDRGGWWATGHRVAKSRTRPKWLSTHTDYSMRMKSTRLFKSLLLGLLL